MRIARRWGLLAMVLVACRGKNASVETSDAASPVVRLPEGRDGSVALPLEGGGSLVASGTARWTLVGAKVTFGPDFPEEITRVRGSVADGFWFWGASPSGHLWYAPSALAPAERVAEGGAVTVGRFAVVAAGVGKSDALRVFERGREIPSPLPAAPAGATTGIRLVTLTFGKPEVTRSFLIPTDGGAFRPSEFVLENGQLALKPVPESERDAVGVALALHDSPTRQRETIRLGSRSILRPHRIGAHRFDDGSRLLIDEPRCHGCSESVEASGLPRRVAATELDGRPIAERGERVGTNLYDCALLSDHGPTAHLFCAVGEEPLRQSVRVTASGKVTMERKFAIDQTAPMPGTPVLEGSCDPDGDGKVQNAKTNVCIFSAKSGRWATYTYPNADLLGVFPSDDGDPVIVTGQNETMRVARGAAEISRPSSRLGGDVLAVNADGTLFAGSHPRSYGRTLGPAGENENGPLTATSPSTTTPLLPNVRPTDVGMAGRAVAVHRSIEGAEVLVVGHLREDAPAIAWTGTIPLHRPTGPSAVACDTDGCELGPFRYPWSTARPLTAAPADGKIPGSAIPPVTPVAEELARFANFRCTPGAPINRDHRDRSGTMSGIVPPLSPPPPVERGELSFSVFDAGRTVPVPNEEGYAPLRPVVSNLPRAYARLGSRYQPTVLAVGARSITLKEEIRREIDHFGPGGEIPAPGTSIAVSAKSGAVLKPRLLRPMGAPATAITPYRFEGPVRSRPSSRETAGPTLQGPVDGVPQVLATTLEIDGQGRCTATTDDDVRFIPGPEAWEPAFGKGRQRLLVRGNATRLCLEALEVSEEPDAREGRRVTLRFSDAGKAPYGSLVDRDSVFAVTCVAK